MIQPALGQHCGSKSHAGLHVDLHMVFFSMEISPRLVGLSGYTFILYVQVNVNEGCSLTLAYHQHRK
jgi:hypothetical protein